MLNSIRKMIATAIAPNELQPVPAGVRDLTYNNLPAHTRNQVPHTPVTKYNGFVTTDDLQQLTSEYLKDAIAQLGAWSSLARAFGEYEKVINKRSKDDILLGKYLDEFHSWNAVTSTGKQMDEEQLILAVSKMAVVRPPKGNPATDAIIARVRGCSIQELAKTRELEAAKQSAKREELIKGFCAQAWQFTSSDLTPQIAGSKAVLKAASTMEFVATYWQGDPANIAGELLLMEADMRTLETIASKEGSDNGERFIDGTLTADGMMTQ